MIGTMTNSRITLVRLSAMKGVSSKDNIIWLDI